MEIQGVPGCSASGVLVPMDYNVELFAACGRRGAAADEPLEARKTLHEVIKGVEIERRTLMRPNSFPHRALSKTYSRRHEAGSEKASFRSNEI